MNKILVALLGFSIGIASAAPAAVGESSAVCQQYHQQMRANHQAIDNAYHKNDACTMGKLMMQNRQMFESHPECFPRMEKMQKRMMQGGCQGGANCMKSNSAN